MDKVTERRLISEVADLIGRRATAMAPAVRHQPASAYTDPDRLRAEREVLFTRYPLVVAASAAVPGPGDFVTLSVAGTPVIVVRGDDGVVRTLLNVCRHRANRVCHAESGTTRTFTCDYHAWTYDRRGRARSFVDKQAFDSLDLAGFGLHEFPTEERHGLVWCVPTAGATIDVAGYLGPDVDAEIAGYRAGDWTLYRRTTLTDQPFGWKLGVDTYHEAFHLSFLHKKSVGPYFLGNTMAYESFGLHQRYVTVRTSFPEMLAREESEQDLFGHSGIVYFLFPNSVFVWQMDHLELWTLFPDPHRDDRCTVHGTLLVPEAPATERAQRHWDNNWRALETAIMGEDFETMTRIQANLESGQIEELVFGRNEPSLQDFHRNVAAELERAGR